MSVMNGFREELLSRILGLNGHVEVMAAQGALRQYDDVAQWLRSVDGVISAIPVVEGQVMVTAHNTAVGGLVRGLRGEDLKRRPILANNIVAGSTEEDTSELQSLIRHSYPVFCLKQKIDVKNQ